MKIINAKVYTKDFTFKDQDIAILNDKFVDTLNDKEVCDAQGLMAIPGLVDTHFHGAVGYDFMDGTPEALDAIARYEASVGVTSICPATMTMSTEDIVKACENAKNYQIKDDCANLVGIYMEGPFVSHQKVGAQNPKFVKEPSAEFFDMLQKHAGNLIKVMAIAPEAPNGIETIKALKGKVLCSIAHTICKYETAATAIANGATRLTHLYNAMPSLLHRDPGPIGAGSEAPWCEAEIICDGIHIHPSAVRAAFKLFNKDEIILISDSMMAVGLEDGEYELGGQRVEVKNRLATLDNGTIAGSATNLFDCMKIAHLKMNIPLEVAIKAASFNPARSIGALDKCGSIEAGKNADLLLVDEKLNLKAIMLRGKWIKKLEA